MQTSYMENALRQFEYYKMLGEKTFGRLTEEQLFRQNGDASNSVANIIRHMWGFMLSRWPDFMTANGEKDLSTEEAEFEREVVGRSELLQKWEEGWGCLFEAVRPLTDGDLGTIVYIRNQEHTVMEVINGELCHYAYHVGQIVCIGKLLTGSAWESFSSLRGQFENSSHDKSAQSEGKETIEKKD